MIITLGQAREVVAEFAGRAGKCKDSNATRLFVMEVVERLLFEGAHGNERKWRFCLCNGCFTAPIDMEVPLKFKIDGRSERVWSKWYEFYDVNGADRCDAGYVPGLFEEIGNFYTIYDMPKPGARLAAIPLGDEEKEAYIIVQGTDVNGRDVFTDYCGREIHGELLPISRNKPSFSKTVFSKITGIEKTQTNTHVRLYWQTYDPVAKVVLQRGLLGEYRPTDKHPAFRRFRVPAAQSDCCVDVSILGRIKLLDFYHDNDILPVTSISSLKRMALAIRAEGVDNVQVASYHEQGAIRGVDNENQYYRTGEDPFDFNFDLSPGSNENLQ